MRKKLRKSKEKKEKKEEYEVSIEKINLQDEKIIVFEKIPNTNYYKPLNKNALDYLKNQYKKYQKEKLFKIEYTVIDEKEAALKKFATNLIGKFLNETPTKDKGVIKLSPEILVYINSKELIPLNSNAEENQKYLNKLVTQSPIYCKEAWININEDFEGYYTLI